MSMALDPKVRHSLAVGDWVGTMAHGSYHTPFIGNGRNAWDAWQMGKPWSAAGHAGLFSIEAWGMRSAGKVRGSVLRGGVAKGAGKVEAGGAKNATRFEKLKSALAQEEILSAKATASALKDDPNHRAASFVVDDIVTKGKFFSIKGNDGLAHNLTQMKGAINEKRDI